MVLPPYARRLLAVCFSLEIIRGVRRDVLAKGEWDETWCLAFFSARPTPFAFAMT